MRTKVIIQTLERIRAKIPQEEQYVYDLVLDQLKNDEKTVNLMVFALVILGIGLGLGFLYSKYLFLIAP